ncbi:hypothetical protein [Demequina sp. NBRC 110056]|uniref:hypothetical protein n=1 Tax=Demequina sp. NBRC 110056 TaxID=1570345 RepID=UPI0013565437|nr:hypothetical protein [Demequina sp. NBRC 110056]
MAPMRTPRRALALVGLLALAGCATSADSSAPAEASASADMALTLEAAASPSPADHAVVLQHLVAMDAPSADGSLGAGCTVEDDAELADGAWYGFVVDYAVTTITLDVACAFGPGTDQFEAFAAAGDDATYVVVNDVVDERVLRFTSATHVMLEEDAWEPVSPDQARHALDPEVAGGHVAVWVCIEDGRVVEIVQPAAQEVAAG